MVEKKAPAIFAEHDELTIRIRKLISAVKIERVNCKKLIKAITDQKAEWDDAVEEFDQFCKQAAEQMSRPNFEQLKITTKNTTAKAVRNGMNAKRIQPCFSPKTVLKAKKIVI